MPTEDVHVYETSDHPKWQSVRHWLEDVHAMDRKNIDGKGVPVTPKPDLDAKLFEDPTDHGRILDHLPDEIFLKDPPAHELGLPPETPTAQPQ